MAALSPGAPGPAAKTGILLINLGTPDAPTKAALRRYLAEFLSDPRVVEIPRLLWLPVLYGIILNTRPAQSAAKYAAVWGTEGSPLLVHTQRQAKLLQGLLGERGHAAAVECAMRYGQPSIAQALGSLKEKGCGRVLALPLYPQYAGATTASALDGVFQALMKERDLPELRAVRHYPDHPGYIAALAASVREHWQAQARGGTLVLSFHGIPKITVERGDPYRDDCLRTAQALATALELQEDQYRVTFQSRFGPAQWLQPYTADTLQKLARAGVERVDVICPGFPADCLETLEEIALEGKTAFLAAGGREFHYIPALNERPDWIASLADIAAAHLGGWDDAA
ncbi:MAG: ferrochelatase [Sulfuricellaceae bacterium]|nr:ferrochelatase [Sulfuricellaceae bacterium]